MRTLVPLASLLLVACGTDAAKAPVDDSAATTDDETGPIDLTVSLELPAVGYQVETPPYTVPPFSEVNICSVVRVEPKADEAVVWFNALESLSADGSHHMNVSIGQFSFLDGFVGEGASMEALGTDITQMPCEDLELMGVGVPVFPSQRDNQRITMPDGVAAPMPLPMVAVFSHHYVNAGERPVIINTALNIETVASEDVEVTANLLFDDIGELEIEPGTRRTYSRTCVAERDVSVALVSTHTHEWAECTTLNRFDGQTETVEQTPFYINQNWDQPPILHFEPETMELAAGDGIHWACHYENATDSTIINNGKADGEMCVFAAVTWPATQSVEEIEGIIEDKNLVELMNLLGDVLGPCDTVRDDVAGPWSAEAGSIDGGGVCEGMPQTESNTLD